jgi:squalene synthase HpnC
MSTVAPPATAALPSQRAVMGKAEHENFTVASAVLGRRRQRHLMAIYGFARLVDDVGDEVPGDRPALLTALERELDHIYDSEPVEHPIMRSLAPTIADCRLPKLPFRRLIEANRRDQHVVRYETFADLLDYCQLSAAPVGELVLHVFGLATPERVALSDRVCAGLQVTEHLQDIREDYGRGRVYLPREDLARFGCREQELATPHRSPSCRALIEFEVERARTLLGQGARLVRTLPLRPRLAVAGFVAGGRTALDALSDADDAGQPRRRRPRRRLGVALLEAASGR